MSFAIDLFTGSQFVGEKCCNCGVTFAMEASFQQERLKDHKNFFCPNGHSQHYTGETEADKLKKKVKNLETQLQWAEDRATRANEQANSHFRGKQIIKGKFKHMKARVANGVCPCCQRTFQNLMRHMKSQHPKFKGEEVSGN